MSLYKIHSLLAALGLLLVSAPAAFSEVENTAFPTKQALHSIQLQAYICSRKNQTEACTLTRQMVDPLMDHPRLSSSCKDAVWELLQAAQTASTNSFLRRDSIDRPAHRLYVVCINQTMKKAPKPSSQGGLVPQ